MRRLALFFALGVCLFDGLPLAHGQNPNIPEALDSYEDAKRANEAAPEDEELLQARVHAAFNLHNQYYALEDRDNAFALLHELKQVSDDRPNSLDLADTAALSWAYMTLFHLYDEDMAGAEKTYGEFSAWLDRRAETVGTPGVLYARKAWAVQFLSTYHAYLSEPKQARKLFFETYPEAEDENSRKDAAVFFWYPDQLRVPSNIARDSDAAVRALHYYDIIGSLMERFPDNADIREERAMAAKNLGFSAWLSGDLASVGKFYNDILVLAEKTPENDKIAAHLAYASVNQAFALLEKGDTASLLALYEKSDSSFVMWHAEIALALTRAYAVAGDCDAALNIRAALYALTTPLRGDDGSDPFDEAILRQSWVDRETAAACIGSGDTVIAEDLYRHVKTLPDKHIWYGQNVSFALTQARMAEALSHRTCAKESGNADICTVIAADMVQLSEKWPQQKEIARIAKEIATRQ